MLDIMNKVPEVYRTSRDFQVFLRLLEMLFNNVKYDIDNWLDLYDPMKCPDKFLPYLSDLIGYNYNTSLSVIENRIIMSRFVQMIKNRGSDVGIRMAAALSLNAQLASDPSSQEYKDAVNHLQYLETYFDKSTGEITIYYPKELKKTRELMHYVRPAGTTVKYKPSVILDVEGNNLGIYTDVQATVNKYDAEKSSKVNHANIGVSPISSQVPKYYYNVECKIDNNTAITRYSYSADENNSAIAAISAAHAKSQVKKMHSGSSVTFIKCERAKDPATKKSIYVKES